MRKGFDKIKYETTAKPCNLFDSNHENTVTNGNGYIPPVENTLDKMERKRFIPSSKSDSIKKSASTPKIKKDMYKINENSVFRDENGNIFSHYTCYRKKIQ